MMRNKCPLCRAELPSPNEVRPMIEQHAGDGRAWAQCKVGVSFWNGMNKFPVNKAEGLNMFRLAAEKRDSDAMFALAMIYETGFVGLVEQSNTRYMSLLEEAVELGHPDAQVNLAQVFGRSEREDIQRKGVFYA